MRKGLVFKKGIIFALAAAVVTSPAPVMGVSGWGVMNAKAEETTTEKIPKYLLMGSTRLIDNGELQDDGVSGNDDTIYQGTNWYYDITRNQLVLEMRIFLETLRFRTVIFRLCYPEQIL